MKSLLLTTILFACSLRDMVESKESIMKPQKVTIDIYGSIIFVGGAPDTIPAGSWLTVTLQDNSLADAPSVDLGQSEMEIKKYDKHIPLKYHIKAALPDEAQSALFELSALITIGEKRQNIKEQDYLSMSVHSLDINENSLIYKHQDIEVEKYE